jgi:hypothetical protein
MGSRLVIEVRISALTFFCNLITDVHFFSNNPTHFALGSSTSKSSFSVSRFSASYVPSMPDEWRYESIALCLQRRSQSGVQCTG